MRGLAKIDTLIRAGRGTAARAEMTALMKKRLPREWLVQAARLACRLGQPAWGIRLLNPLVRPSERSVAIATDEEKAEYAYCLVKIGAAYEAERLLAEIASKHLPQCDFYRAAVAISRWDYAAALAPLFRYVEASGITPYQRLIGRLNLAASLVYEGRHHEARPILRGLLHDGSLRGFDLVLGRAMEIAAESFLSQRRWSDAATFLDQAEHRLAGSAGLDHLFVRKFQAYLPLLRDPSASRAPVEAVREEARRLGHWETVRDCDRTLAVATGDLALFKRVYFGTPHESYRRRLLAELESARALDLSRFEWQLSGESGEGPLLDLFAAEGDFRAGRLSHRLLVALSSDFYRPLRVAELFAAVHPDRHFHPRHSPPLISSALGRLRAAAGKRGLSLGITVKGGFHRIHSRKPLRLVVHASETLTRRYGPLVERLRSLHPREYFSIQEALSCLPLSRRTVLRLLKEACADGALESRGQGPSFRYRFKDRG